MPGKQGQAKIKKQKQPLNSQFNKSVCVSTLIFSQKKISLGTYSCFIHKSKMFGNVDFHIPQHTKRNKFLSENRKKGKGELRCWLVQ